MLETNERTRVTLTLEFTDENGAAVIPASFTYRIDEPSFETEVLATQTVTPTASTHSLVITATQNTCIGSKDELRRVTVVATGLVAGQCIYKLLKLKGAA